MGTQQVDIIAGLKKDILLLSGFKPVINNSRDNGGLGLISQAFPNNSFPSGAIHEFISGGAEDSAASYGFIAGVVASLMKNNGASVWISPSPMIFPPALQQFGIDPAKVILIHPRKEKDIVAVTEEALRCEGFTAVVSDIREPGFIESRRYQLAVEQSNVTGFIVRHRPKNMSTASVARWKITSLASAEEYEFPGLAFSRWNVELLKIRNGKPRSWQLEWKDERFNLLSKDEAIIVEQLRKIG
jgi:protein ImuA